MHAERDIVLPIPSVYLPMYVPVVPSIEMDILSHFFDILVIPVFVPHNRKKKFNRNPLARAVNTRDGNFFCNFRLKLLFISETVRDMPMVAIEL